MISSRKVFCTLQQLERAKQVIETRLRASSNPSSSGGAVRALADNKRLTRTALWRLRVDQRAQ